MNKQKKVSKEGSNNNNNLFWC